MSLYLYELVPTEGQAEAAIKASTMLSSPPAAN